VTGTPLKTSVLIADDHAVVRHGVRALFDRVPDLDVVAEAIDGDEAVARALAGDIDLAILDIAMPRMTGLQAARELKRRAPHVRTLMLSMYDDEQYFFQALRAGASGYVLKSAADRELIEACRATMRGEPFVHAGAVAALIEDYLERVRRGEAGDDDPLTPRELEVLKLVAEAYTSEQLANTLVISIKTVERHRSNIMDKLGMRDRVQLTRYAIRRGLITP
jgi:DNA-binding NarL/FixJ family response regulator